MRPGPRPWWLTLPGLLGQTVGLALLPFAVGLSAAVWLEVGEVADTAWPLVALTVSFLFPVSLAQVLGLLVKTRRELRLWRQREALTASRLLEVLHDHVRVVTARGWVVLVTGLACVVLSLALRWASFGTLAVIALFLFYLVTGWTVFASTFLVGGFERSRRGVRRQLSPAVVTAGSSVEEVFTFTDVPVPWGYYLLVEDPLPARLGTESRYVVGAGGSGVVEARGRLRRTPRGLYRLGPARLWYQDVLGITRVSLVRTATADLEVLPPIRPVRVVEPPRAPTDAPDVLTKLDRLPTEDHFRFRVYSPGDDTRRLHWRLSMKTGRLQVRVPENREITTRDVLLVLDAWLPPGETLDAAHGADEILDALVEAWLGIAKALVEQGDRVTLVAACAGTDSDEVTLARVPCRPGDTLRWQDLGARVRWQGRYDLTDVLSDLGDAVHGVVVTARFTAPPPALCDGQALSWLFMDPADAFDGPEPHWLVDVLGGGSVSGVFDRVFRLPYPAGSEDNTLARQLRSAARIRRRALARAHLRRVAAARAGQTLAELAARGDAVYRIERSPTHVRLVGLRGARAGRWAS